MELAIADQHRYRLAATERDGQWRAQAVRADTGDRFGPEQTGATEQEALGRLTRWLEWQHAHAAALEELQGAERVYHRTLASAFASEAAGPGDADRREALEAVDAARARLDDIRARRPL